MKGVVLGAVGGPEMLEYTDLPEPEAGAGQVLIRVRGAGVNFADILMRQGRYPGKVTLPAVMGIEVAGDVVAVGPDVTGVAVGDRVVAYTESGGYAELVSVRAGNVLPLPASASYVEGAAFLITFLTAYIPLRYQVRVGPGSTVLVHAAAGGVGSAAVQIARQMGARVLATSSSDEKLAVAAGLGADVTINYATTDFGQAVRAVTAGQGVDVVVDPVGGSVFDQSLKVLKPLGNVISIGAGGGALAKMDPALLVGRSIGVQGIFLGRLFSLAPHLVREAYAEVCGLWVQGAVRPLVGARYALREAAAAHRLVEDRRSVGKVVLVP